VANRTILGTIMRAADIDGRVNVSGINFFENRILMFGHTFWTRAYKRRARVLQTRNFVKKQPVILFEHNTTKRLVRSK